MSPHRQLVVALSAVLVLLAGLDYGIAKSKPKSAMALTFNRKVLKSVRRAILGQYSTAIFTVGGSTRVSRRKYTGFAISCAPVNLQTVTLPATFTDCGASVIQTDLRHPAQNQTWTSFGTVAVTVQSYTGGRAIGTFRGTIDSATTPSEPPATVEGGSFSVLLTNSGT